MLKGDSLGLEGYFFKIFHFFFVLNFLGFGLFDLIFYVIFGQQKLHDVLGVAFTSDLGSVLLGVLLAILADFDCFIGSDLDNDLFDLLLLAFEINTDKM